MQYIGKFNKIIIIWVSSRQFVVGWELPISAVNFGVLGVKIGEDIFGFRSQPNQFFLFRPQRFLPNFVKIVEKCDRRRVHRHTDREIHIYTDTQQLIWLSAPRYGADNLKWYDLGQKVNVRVTKTYWKRSSGGVSIAMGRKCKTWQYRTWHWRTN